MSRSCTLVWGRENRKRGLTGGCWVGRASVRREAERGVCCSARAESLQGVCSSLIFFLTLSLSLCCGVCVSPAYIAAARLVFVRAFSELFCPSFERSFVLCCARLRERERDGGRGCVIGRRAPLGLAGAINSVGSTPGRLVLGHFALSGVADHVKVCVLCAVCFCLLRGGCCKCLVLSCLVHDHHFQQTGNNRLCQIFVRLSILLCGPCVFLCVSLIMCTCFCGSALVFLPPPSPPAAAAANIFTAILRVRERFGRSRWKFGGSFCCCSRGGFLPDRTRSE